MYTKHRFKALLGGEAAATSAASDETSSIIALLGDSSGVPISPELPVSCMPWLFPVLPSAAVAFVPDPARPCPGTPGAV